MMEVLAGGVALKLGKRFIRKESDGRQRLADFFFCGKSSFRHFPA